jgi:hypothetical protein
MVDHCANPECGKPMLYLREGSIYCFEEIDPGDGSGNPFGHRLKHYWLCGNCSANHLLERTTDKQILLTSRPSLHFIRQPAAITGRMPLSR